MKNDIWLYTVYRNSDDAIICFEVPSETAAEILGWKEPSFRQMFYRSGGQMRDYTIIRKAKSEVLREMDDIW